VELNNKQNQSDLVFGAIKNLRDPVTTLRGSLEMLDNELADIMDANQKKALQQTIAHSDQLADSVNNIHEAALIDQAYIRINLSEVSVADVYAKIQPQLEKLALSQHKLLSAKISDDLPNVVADPYYLEIVVKNLVNNAIKFSNKGGAINITASSNPHFVELQIIDYGCGMPESVMADLFKKHHRSESSASGSGLGLYVSNFVTGLHGGTISARSEPDKGSIFRLTIPTYTSVKSGLKLQSANNTGIQPYKHGWVKYHKTYKEK
jgi:signal transduction histidine kinase